MSERGKADQFHGAYGEIVRGVNAMLDAIIGPLNFSAKYVDRISKGDMPPLITDTYNGDFNLIKNNLNALIDAMNEITAGAEQIANGNMTVVLKERSPQDKLMQGAGHEATCIVFGMPKEAIKLNGVDKVMPLGSIAGAILTAAR